MPAARGYEGGPGMGGAPAVMSRDWRASSFDAVPDHDFELFDDEPSSYPEVRRCRNPRCRVAIIGVALCRPCALAGAAGAAVTLVAVGLVTLVAWWL